METWKAAISEALYQYNLVVYQSTGYTPQLLHNGQEVSHPGLLHPDQVPANIPVHTHEDLTKFTKRMQDLRLLL